jgi:hypothetical protein
MRKTDYPSHRKSPIEHTVKAHERRGRSVKSFRRGHDKAPAKIVDVYALALPPQK